mgnify:CR=1 FL=1
MRYGLRNQKLLDRPKACLVIVGIANNAVRILVVSQPCPVVLELEILPAQMPKPAGFTQIAENGLGASTTPRGDMRRWTASDGPPYVRPPPGVMRLLYFGRRGKHPQAGASSEGTLTVVEEPAEPGRVVAFYLASVSLETKRVRQFPLHKIPQRSRVILRRDDPLDLLRPALTNVELEERTGVDAYHHCPSKSA